MHLPTAISQTISLILIYPQMIIRHLLVTKVCNLLTKLKTIATQGIMNAMVNAFQMTSHVLMRQKTKVCYLLTKLKTIATQGIMNAMVNAFQMTNHVLMRQKTKV